MVSQSPVESPVSIEISQSSSIARSLQQYSGRALRALCLFLGLPTSTGHYADGGDLNPLTHYNGSGNFQRPPSR